MKISNKEKNLLLYVLAILIVFASYKFAYEKFTTETDTLKISNGTLESTRDRLKGLKDSEQQFIEDIEKFKEENEIILAKYGATQNFEDFIMTVKEVEDKEDAFATSLSVSPAVIQDIPYPQISGVDANLVNQEQQTLVFVDANGNEVQYSNPAGVFLVKQQLNMNVNTTYNGMKDFISYFIDNEDIMNLESVALNYNALTGELTGGYVINAYSMRGNGAEYKATEVSGVKLGVNNLFGSYQAPVATE